MKENCFSYYHLHCFRLKVEYCFSVRNNVAEQPGNYFLLVALFEVATADFLAPIVRFSAVHFVAALARYVVEFVHFLAARIAVSHFWVAPAGYWAFVHYNG
jgi:hypothetical protein